MFAASNVKWYVGIYGQEHARPGRFNPFQSSKAPTQASHGHMFAVTVGPFKTKRAALSAGKIRQTAE